MWNRSLLFFIFVFLAFFPAAAMGQHAVGTGAVGVASSQKSKPVYPENEQVAALKQQYQKQYQALMEKLDAADPTQKPALQHQVEKLKADERQYVLELMLQIAADAGDTEQAIGASDALNDQYTPKKVEPVIHERTASQGFAPYVKKPDDRDLE